MTSIKNCTIIYGYTDNCLDDIDQDSPVLLIEPRNEFIDKIRSLRNSNILLISKVLTHKKSFQETTLYYKKENDIYWLRDDTLTVNGFNMFNIRKYVTYTITLEDIISQYKLQNIKAFIVNLNITNITQILDSLSRYNHIVSNIYIKNEIQEECKIVVYYNKQQVQGTETGTETGIETGAYFKYVHKNLNVELPSIAMYFLNANEKLNSDELNLLISQYKMNIIIRNEDESNCLDSDVNKMIIVPYPESVQIIKQEPLTNIKASKIFFENVVNTLDTLFSAQSTSDSIIQIDNLDIIIQFNPKYFSNNKTLQIMYPLKDNTIYINRLYDIMYASKNCMYMIYQILKSKYFTDYIDSKRQERPGLFKIFSKRYFYDYLSKIFVFKEF
jgi:hypothetical protein